MSNPFRASFMTSFAGKLKEFADEHKLAGEAYTKFLAIDSFMSLLDDVTDRSIIRPVPDEITDLVNASNRIVSLVFDDSIHIGNGILVGPAHVLTAAHLFFEPDQTLIEEHRPQRITVEARTTYLGNVLMDGPRKSVKLEYPNTDAWSIEPKVIRGKATREVTKLDFVIVKLAEPLGTDSISHAAQRHWFEIPSVTKAPILSPDLGIRVLEFLDRGALLTSIGFVRSVLPDGSRVLHTASTEDSASGSPMVSDDFNLLGVHLGGSASGEQPKSNRGLPIRRVAEVIDAIRSDGTTIRSELK